MADRRLVAAVVVDWNRPEETAACLRSLRASDYQNLKVILVDNGSSRSSEAEYSSILPGLVYRRLERNLGFAAGCNVGIAIAREQEVDYILLLNNDAEVAPDAIERLIDCAENHSSFGALTAAIFHQNSRRLWHAGARTLIVWPFARRITLAELDGPEPVPVDFATGCALLIRKTVIEAIGGLDERFFMYSEDNDFCLRMRQAGFRIGAVPTAQVWHRVSRSAGEGSPARAWLRSRSRLLYFRKHAQGLSWLAVAASISVYLARGLVAGALNGRWDTIRPLVAGSFGTGDPTAWLHRPQNG